MKNHNPNLDEFLKIYSQSLLSTGLTRGLDERTYIQTKLDTALKTDILEGKKKLVVLTGNAGDGKTAFIQLIENSARKQGAVFELEADNGCNFSFNGISPVSMKYFHLIIFFGLLQPLRDINLMAVDFLCKQINKPAKLAIIGFFFRAQ